MTRLRNLYCSGRDFRFHVLGIAGHLRDLVMVVAQMIVVLLFCMGREVPAQPLTDIKAESQSKSHRLRVTVVWYGTVTIFMTYRGWQMRGNLCHRSS